MNATHDPLRAPLAGRTVVEASAGTGKTYIIVGLYLRLILEAGLNAQSVLVMSFTRAATAELKDRLRQGLALARHLFRQRVLGRDPVSEDRIMRYLLELDLDPAAASRRLDAALAAFDEAAVYTIHGFCQRALQEHAFESGQPFVMELIADEDVLLNAVAEDFWRHMNAKATPALLGFLARKKQTPSKALRRIRGYIGQPELRIERPAMPRDDDGSRDSDHDWTAWLDGELITWCNRHLPERKRRERIWTYDDLLRGMYDALNSARGKALARGLRKRYTAALIDEFQDTDPLQYAIFDQIYSSGNEPVFFVGDPKQAIYSFRRADVFAYLRARNRAENPVCNLNRNWRSSPELVRAVSAIFQLRDNPFLLPEIVFEPVSAQPRAHDALHDVDTSPLTIWFWESKERVEVARRRVADCVAAEIARLLSGTGSVEAEEGRRPITGGDIAVLVRNHAQGRAIRTALSSHGVNSVQLSQDSVFETDEAAELEYVLNAVAEPSNANRLRLALATRIIGRTAEQLQDLLSDDRAWDEEFERFQAYNGVWREQGLVPMLSRLLGDYDTARRFLATAGGERRLTNVLHLSELLHRAARSEGLGMEAVIKWFGERREQDPRQEEDRLLRLESDERLVKVTTIHRSKGLQYPIVFCPFLWNATETARAPFSFHDPAQDHQAVLHLGHEPREAAKQRAQFEGAAESVRLAYVALTRARYRCYIVWGPIAAGRYEKSALSWLLHGGTGSVHDWESFEAACEVVKGRDTGALRRDLQTLCRHAGGALAVEDMPEAKATAPPPTAPTTTLEARRFRGSIVPGWRISSYSGLTRGRALELPDYDGWLLSEALGSEHGETGRDIFGFPRGARAGQCVHSILERLSFQAPPDELGLAVQDGLKQYGFSSDWSDVLSGTLMDMLRTPLAVGGPRLADIDDAHRVDELEFTFPVAALDDVSFEALLMEHGEKALLRRQDRSRGFMKGFIDLVFRHEDRFHIVDYKSNWLGASLDDYASGRLPPVIQREGYNLQYLLYTLALHRLLKWRYPGYEYDRHFGGVFYLFMRGMREETGPAAGVYADRPEAALIEAMDEYFHGTGMSDG